MSNHILSDVDATAQKKTVVGSQSLIPVHRLNSQSMGKSYLVLLTTAALYLFYFSAET